MKTKEKEFATAYLCCNTSKQYSLVVEVGIRHSIMYLAQFYSPAL